MADVTNTEDNIQEKIAEMINLINEGKYSFVEKEWRFLSSEVRLELMEYCLKNGLYYFINEQHFQKWNSDISMLKGAVKEYAEKLHMSEEQVAWLKDSFRGKIYDGKETVKLFATYVRMKEYYQLTEKYDFYTPELISQNLRMLKCDSRRTDARIQFLLEQSPDGIVADSQFVKEIIDRNKEFNFRHQDVLEEKMEAFQSKEEYVFLLDIVQNDVSENVYAKFLEYALRTFYGDKRLLERIEYKRRQFTQRASEGKKEDAPVKMKTVMVERGDRITSITVPEDVQVVSQEDIEKILKRDRESASVGFSLEDEVGLNDLFTEINNAFPIEEKPFIKRKSGTKEREVSGKKPLDKKAIKKYIDGLENMGIPCEGCISTTEGGTKAAGEDSVYYYIFSQGKYRVLEPIGQPNNRTLIMRLNEEEDNLEALVKNNSISKLVKDGIMCRLNHRTNGEREYDYCYMRLANILQLINEGVKSQTWDRDRIKSEITELLPKEEIPNAMQYITGISKNTAYEIKKKVRILESKANQSSSELSSEAGEVDF